MFHISDGTLKKWQHIVDFVAKVVEVPACLVMRTNAPEHTVFVSNSSAANPYHAGQQFELSPNLYCETVLRTRSEVIVEDARHDPRWPVDPGKDPDMTFYIGRPLLWPDGQLFGTICIWDRLHNPKALRDREIMERFQEVIEADLALIQEAARRKEMQGKLTNVLSELEQHTAELEIADQRKNEFLAMLAHELRNPLAPLRSAAQLLKTEQNVPQLADLIERQVGQLARIISDLLEVNMIVQDRLTLQLEDLELRDVVKLAVETCEPRVQKRQQTLSISLPEHPVALHADRTRLSQILGNLLHNASKYTPSGGHISLIVDVEGTEAVFRIRDDGIGLAPEHLDQIFELFMRVDNSPDQATGGTGMGLTYVRKLVTLHGGTVQAFSAGLGSGSEFVVRLPVSSSVPSRPEPKHPNTTPVRKLLLVDDNIDAADTLAALLRRLGIDVKTAYDGPDAIETASRFAPEVVLLDLGMPVLDGFATCEQIRKGKGGKDLIIIALTGWSQSDITNKISLTGFDAHLVKPATLTSVIEAINAAHAARSGSTARTTTPTHDLHGSC